MELYQAFVQLGPAEMSRLSALAPLQSDEEREELTVDTERLEIPLDGYLTLQRAGRPLASQGDTTYQLSIGQRGRVESVKFGVTRAEAPQYAERYFSLSGAEVYFSCRFRRRRYRSARGSLLSLDTEHRFFSHLKVNEPLFLAEQSAPTLSGSIHPDDQELLTFIQALESLPLTAKRWMGYYYMKRFYHAPVHNELPGYEYELKLKAKHLNLELDTLPFPLFEVHQSESSRWYCAGRRIGFRGTRASVVRKGPVEVVQGILKREEVKEKALSTWALDRDIEMEMVRRKRQLYLKTPETGRVYTISLDYCLSAVAPKPFLQVEVEYNGRLLDPEVSGSERYAEPAFFLELGERCEARGDLHRAAKFYRFYLQLNADVSTRDELEEKISRFQAESLAAARAAVEAPPAEVDLEIEQAVLDDLNSIKAALIARYGFKESRKTKKKWLKKQYKRWKKAQRLMEEPAPSVERNT